MPSPVERATTLRRTTSRSLRHWIPSASLAIVDQALFAGANFFANIALARLLSISAYGAFAVLYAIYLLSQNVHSAFITEPMLVFGSGEFRGRLPRYLRWLVGRTLLLGALTAAGALVVALLVLGQAFTLEAALAGSLLAGTGLLIWLARRAAYTIDRPDIAAAGSAAYLAVVVAGIVALSAVGRLTAATALLVLVAASLVGSLSLPWTARAGAAGVDPGGQIDPAAALTRHWGYGRWALPGTALRWMSTNALYLALPVLAGVAATATLRAFMNLLMPILQVNVAVSLILIPLFVRRRRAAGIAGVRSSAAVMTAVLWLGATAFAALFYFGYGWAVEVLYRGKFDVPRSALLLGAIIPFASALIASSGAVLRSLEAVRALFIGYAVALVGILPVVVLALLEPTTVSVILAQAAIIGAVAVALTVAAFAVTRRIGATGAAA